MGFYSDAPNPVPSLTQPLSAEEKGRIPRADPLPMTFDEVQKRGWSEVDLVFVTGDAYVDHPAFAAGLLGRVLEADGFRVAILSQPDWKSAAAWKTFGRPRLAFCIGAGNMDSMINHYTASRKVRNDDSYSPDGKIGRRPDRATLSYAQRAREAYPGIPILIGGIEASLRRFAHYDYWSDKVKRSILIDSKASILVYGMGESPLREIVRRLDSGESISTLTDISGTAIRLGKTVDLPEESDTLLHLPSYEEVTESGPLFAEMTRQIHLHLNPYCAKTLVQEHADEAIQVNPPSKPLTTAEMDRIYSLPFTRKAHPSYGTATIPALEVVKDSVTILRGCFGGCAFCALTAHQGKIVQSRSEKSILTELKQLTKNDRFGGTVTDLGGPTANMYAMGCCDTDAQKSCRKPSCLHPTICPNLKTDTTSLIELYRKARKTSGVKKVLIASGVRTDLALTSPEYVAELVRHHIGGELSTAPEHIDPVVLDLMQKPAIDSYEQFCELFAAECEASGEEHFLVPYLVAGLPGCTVKSMVGVAEYLKVNGIAPEQVQDFIPAPFSLAGAIFHTGINPLTGERVHVAKGLRERRLQRALLFYYNPAYYHDVKSALKEVRRDDLIGNGPECLIPPYPPKMSNLRQTSRVKRLIKKNAIEKAEKEQARAEWAEKMRLAARNEREARSAERRGSPMRGPNRNDERRSRPGEGRSGERRFERPTGERSSRSSEGRRSEYPAGERRSRPGEGHTSERRNDERRFERPTGERSSRSSEGRRSEYPAAERRSRPSEGRSGERRFERPTGERSSRSSEGRRSEYPTGERRSRPSEGRIGERRNDERRNGEGRFERPAGERTSRSSEGHRSEYPAGERRSRPSEGRSSERRFERPTGERSSRSGEGRFGGNSARGEVRGPNKTSNRGPGQAPNRTPSRPGNRPAKPGRPSGGPPRRGGPPRGGK